MSAPLWQPAFQRAATDARLQPAERSAVIVLWAHLSPVEWRPLKSDAAGVYLKMDRANAARVLRRLVEAGYLVVRQMDARAPREFLLVNVIVERERAA